MTLIRVGNNILNLRYVMRTEEDTPTMGTITVHMAPGESFELADQDAQDLRLALLAICPPAGGRGAQSIVVEPGP